MNEFAYVLVRNCILRRLNRILATCPSCITLDCKVQGHMLTQHSQIDDECQCLRCRAHLSEDIQFDHSIKGAGEHTNINLEACIVQSTIPPFLMFSYENVPNLDDNLQLVVNDSARTSALVTESFAKRYPTNILFGKNRYELFSMTLYIPGHFVSLSRRHNDNWWFEDYYTHRCEMLAVVNQSHPFQCLPQDFCNTNRNSITVTHCYYSLSDSN